MKRLLLLLILALPASGQTLVPRPARDGADLPALECQSHDVHVDIQQQVARVRIEQVFVNNSGADLEAVYVMPLHESASISRFSYWVNGKEIKGQIHEKQEARQMYDQIVGQRRDPALLEQIGRNLFRVNIFPVSSKEPMKVVLEYSQLCPYENGVVSYRYPLTYGSTTASANNFRLHGELLDQKPISSVQVTSHGARTQLTDAHHARLDFQASNFTATQDFSLQYTLKSSDFGVSFLTHRKPGEDGYFMLVVAPQEETSQAQVVRKDVIFVFDRSGSMQGEKIKQARTALKFCLQRLNAQDRFRVIPFSDTAESPQPHLLAATPANIEAALQQADKLEADGGTNIDGALSTAMAGFEPSPNQKVVVFMTDGLPSVGERTPGGIVKNVAAANRQAARLFAFGVGDDVDDYLLLKLASDHRGALQYVRGGESIESKISAFFSKISTPVLVNLQLDFGAIPVHHRYPEIVPDVFKGSQLVLVGRYSRAGKAQIALSGDINGRSRKFAYPAEFPESEDDNAFLERLWAKQRVDWAVDQIRLHGENSELKNEVIGLSKQFMFMTPYTSFLAMPKEERDRLAAASSGGYPTGADPILSVSAPAGARVTAYFPWGETRALAFDPKSKLWKCRFVIPASVPHGVCQVPVVITLPDGQQTRQVVCFEADDEPPSGQVVARMHYTPKTGWQTHVQVQASLDTRRVMARGENGRWVEFKKTAPQTWTALLPPTSRPVEVTLLDNGHNRCILRSEVR